MTEKDEVRLVTRRSILKYQSRVTHMRTGHAIRICRHHGQGGFDIGFPGLGFPRGGGHGWQFFWFGLQLVPFGSGSFALLSGSLAFDSGSLPFDSALGFGFVSEPKATPVGNVATMASNVNPKTLINREVIRYLLSSDEAQPVLGITPDL